MPIHAHPTRTLSRPLAVFAVVALSASIGCIAPPHGGHGGVGTLSHLLGFDGECGCANCPPDGCDITDSSGTCSDLGGCDPNHCDAGATMPACDTVRRVADLPCETATCVTSYCTPHACPGPPDIPPPGRFHPVPTRPVFSPRFAPTPYGPAEF